MRSLLIARHLECAVLCVLSAAVALAARPHHDSVNTPLQDGTDPEAVSVVDADTLWVADWGFTAGPGRCDPSGWIARDERSPDPESVHWRVDSQFSGVGAIHGRAAILTEHDPCWPILDGYGNDWYQAIRIAYEGSGVLSFDFLLDSEIDFDFLRVEVDSSCASLRLAPTVGDPRYPAAMLRRTLFEQSGLDTTSATVGPLAVGDFGTIATHCLYISFHSDGEYSQADGHQPSTLGAALVIDSLRLEGVREPILEDFENGMHPRLSFANISGPPRLYARLHPDPREWDPCGDNEGCAWIFSDPMLPAYTPEMAFGPDGVVVRNWLDNTIISPWIRWPTRGDAMGAVLRYRYFDANNYGTGRIMHNWSVRAKVRVAHPDSSGESLDCTSQWAPYFWNSVGGSTFRWRTATLDLGRLIDPEAHEIQLRYRVADAQWIRSSSPPSPLDPGPGPYLDRIRIGRLLITGPSFSPIPSYSTSADGFPSAPNAIAPGENFSPTTDRFGTMDFAMPKISLGHGGTVGDIATYNTSDSIVVTVHDTHMTGSVWVRFFAAIVSGPHAGKAPPPWNVSANGFFVVDADSARSAGGTWHTDSWCVDLDDAYFRGGDEIVYFWAATDADGGFTSWPPGLTSAPLSVEQAQEATGGLLEFVTLPAIDWDPDYLTRVASHPSGKIEPTPAEVANSHQRASILYVWQRSATRRRGAHHRTAFMHSLDQLGYRGLYDGFFIPMTYSSYLEHVAARASVEQATAYSLIIQDSYRHTWNVLPPPDYRERPVPQVQWYRDWLARAQESEAGRATLWLLGDAFVEHEGNNPLVQGDMGVAVANAPQTLLPFPHIIGERSFTWANGDTTDFAGDRLVLLHSVCQGVRRNTGLASTGTASLTHRYVLDGTPGDGAMIMNSDPAAGWNTILASFSWEDLLEPRGTPMGGKALWLDKILRGVLPDSVRAQTHPTDAPDRTVARPRPTALHQNVPNPFNPTTTIRFDLAADAHAELRIYDVTGRLVRTLLNGPMESSRHAILWDGLDDAGVPVSSGIYFYRLAAGDYRDSRKMVVLR